MKNTVLTSAKENLLTYDDYIFTDYHIFKYNDIKKLDLTTFIDYRILQNNEKLEKISFDLYGSTNYWDILSGLNDLDPMLEMPYDNDIISEISEDLALYYKDNIYFGELPESQYNYLLEEIKKSREINNEKFRTIKIIKPTKLQDFIKLLRTEGII